MFSVTRILALVALFGNLVACATGPKPEQCRPSTAERKLKNGQTVTVEVEGCPVLGNGERTRALSVSMKDKGASESCSERAKLAALQLKASVAELGFCKENGTHFDWCKELAEAPAYVGNYNDVITVNLGEYPVKRLACNKARETLRFVYNCKERKAVVSTFAEQGRCD